MIKQKTNKNVLCSLFINFNDNLQSTCKIPV